MLLKFLSKYRNKVFTLFAALMLSVICSYCQNLIGYKYLDIKKYMKENHKDMNLNDVTNSKFRYLKYSENSDRQTLLFFLNTDSVCRSMRMICDAGIKAEKVKEFNTIYKRSGDNKWLDNRNGKAYLIEIKDEKWYYIITIEPEK